VAGASVAAGRRRPTGAPVDGGARVDSGAPGGAPGGGIPSDDGDGTAPGAVEPATPSADPTHGPAAAGAPLCTLARLRQSGVVKVSTPSGPAVVVALPDGAVTCYSRVCTHAGCTVDYDPASRLLVCPCHGAEYDPAHGAKVVGGPAPAPLSKIAVFVDRSAGVVRPA
jgi:thiosulfate dehydrogenase (quinone) large subunit